MRNSLRLLTLAIALTANTAADAATADTSKGKALAEENCARCHAIGGDGASPHEQAPPFRDIAKQYDEDELEDAFNEGVATDHPDMPDWQMTDSQAHELAVYIMSLTKKP